MVEAARHDLKAWRAKVTRYAQSEWLEHVDTEACIGANGYNCMHWRPRARLTGEVILSTVFVFRRPPSHYTSTGKLRKGAPLAKTSKPDRGKLERAIEDALTDAGVWADDAQVTTSLRSQKRYGREAGAQIAVYVPEEAGLF